MTPTMLTIPANTNINQDKIHSPWLKSHLWLNLNATRDGNMKPNETAVVAPVNLKAVQMFGIMVDPIYMRINRTKVNPNDLFLLSDKGGDPSNTKASTVWRREK